MYWPKHVISEILRLKEISNRRSMGTLIRKKAAPKFSLQNEQIPKKKRQKKFIKVLHVGKAGHIQGETIRLMAE